MEPLGDLSEQYFFFGEAFLFLTRKRNGSNTLLCNNKIFYMGSYTKLILINIFYILNTTCSDVGSPNALAIASLPMFTEKPSFLVN